VGIPRISEPGGSVAPLQDFALRKGGTLRLPVAWLGCGERALFRYFIVMARAFSLVELVVVVVVIAVIAAIAIPRMSSFAWNAKVAATKETVRRAQAVIDEQFAIEGAYPPGIDPAWFPHREIVHALLPNQKVLVEEVPGPIEASDPDEKVAFDTNAPAFWYNIENGHFRARVPPSGTQTLSLYLNINSLSKAPPAGIGGVVVGGAAMGEPE
jgi:prepilin-type N-terminal cleavage/methylation domain-containing protein